MARTTINDWVATETNEKIPDLLPKSLITDATRFVLTNAIYFYANWAEQFDEANTEDREFTALDGAGQSVPMMRQSEEFPYAAVDGHQLVELPYVGKKTSMVVLLPPDGAFERVEGDLNASRLGELLDHLDVRDGSITLPKFTFRSSLSLKNALSQLGMSNAFEPTADFGAMVDRAQTSEPLWLFDVVHEGYVAVDEKGTEAVAATGAVGGASSAGPPPFEMVVDRPFLFLIRDRETGTVLFLGRVVDAEAAQSSR
ncbi:MAG: serpin family protein [Halobacteriota archaeon]